jgi:hypothetical protein
MDDRVSPPATRYDRVPTWCRVGTHAASDRRRDPTGPDRPKPLRRTIEFVVFTSVYDDAVGATACSAVARASRSDPDRTGRTVRRCSIGDFGLRTRPQRTGALDAATPRGGGRPLTCRFPTTRHLQQRRSLPCVGDAAPFSKHASVTAQVTHACSDQRSREQHDPTPTSICSSTSSSDGRCSMSQRSTMTSKHFSVVT